MRLIRTIVWASILVGFHQVLFAQDTVKVYPAPLGVEISGDYLVTVNGKPSPVYKARVGPADDARRWTAMDDLKLSDQMYDPAAFCMFDFAGQANVTVTSPKEVHEAKVLPTSAGITAALDGRSIHFAVLHPANLTIEINGEWCSSLHVFANPVEATAPQADDPAVIYLGPGIHDVGKEGIQVGSGKTLYLAGGAVLRSNGWGGPIISLKGDHIKCLGRGVVDASNSPLHSRSMLAIEGDDIQVEGIILHDSPGWTLPISHSRDVLVRNVKLFSHRKNGDGIDICNSSNVTVDGCFVRTLDDCIVLKTNAPEGDERHVTVKNCVLWNEVAHALSVGAELRRPVDDILFTDCDVIHDIGRCWTLRVYHCDSAPVTNVRFENIRIEQCRRLISLWIGKAEWSQDAARGNISGVTFKNIIATGDPATVELEGFDASHRIAGVEFDHVRVNGQQISSDMVKRIAFSDPVKISP